MSPHRPLDLPRIGVGTSPLGGMPDVYGYDVSPERALATLARVIDSPIRLFYTSNEYGWGDAERRLGRALEGAGNTSDDVIIATKVDPVRGGSVFDALRVRESFDESARRIGRATFPLVHSHDPERLDFDDITAPGGAVEGMVELRGSGKASAIGVAGGYVDQLFRFVDLGVFDVILNHNQYTLPDRRAGALIDYTLAAGMTFINPAPYASGMLAKPRTAALQHCSTSTPLHPPTSSPPPSGSTQSAPVSPRHSRPSPCSSRPVRSGSRRQSSASRHQSA